jgi:hypothetical protein
MAGPECGRAPALGAALAQALDKIVADRRHAPLLLGCAAGRGVDGVGAGR